MKRKLYNVCTICSLLLLCGSIWWWNHSATKTDEIKLRGVGGAALEVKAAGGEVRLTKVLHHDDRGGELTWSSSKDRGDAKLFATSFTFASNGRDGMTLVVPMWAMAFTFAVLPSVWVWSKLKRKGGKKPQHG